ncbi:MAG: hypothetical protein WBD20_26900 [Pirellulaceae bacterium]
MSVRRVNCPQCNAALNVPATMTNVKCSQCATVWDVNHPPAAKAVKKSAASQRSDADDDGHRSAASKKRQSAVIALVGSLFVVFALATIGVILFTGGEDPAPPPVETVAEETPKEKGTYRVVNLPESTRRNIYRDYRLTASSSVEKKVMVSKDSVAAKTVGKTMGLIVDREVTHMALLNGISEEDVMQIVAEGDAEGWPPVKKVKQTDSEK